MTTTAAELKQLVTIAEEKKEEVTALYNGLRVAGQETYRRVSTQNIFANVSFRYEAKENTGINHFMDLLALQYMETRSSSAELIERKKVLSSSTIFTSSREPFMFNSRILHPSVAEAIEILYRDPFMFNSSILHPSVAEAIGILSPFVARPRLTEEVLEYNKVVTQHQLEDMIPKMKFGDWLGIAPYCNQQSVQPHSTTSTSVQHLCPSGVKEFYGRHCREKNFTIVVIVIQVDGWHSSVPNYMLQLFLVGSILFSAGGPSKHQATTSIFVANNGKANGALHRRFLHPMSCLFYKSIVGVRLIVLEIKQNFMLSHPFVEDTTEDNTYFGSHEAGASASEKFLNYAIPIMPLEDGRSGPQNVTLRRSQRVKLSGHSFLLSGCAHVRDQVTRMGGTVVDNVAEIIKRPRGNIWLLSEPTCRRRIKYLLAVALGLPMLHYLCLHDLEEGKFHSLSNDEFYESWRLPTGFNIFSGQFILPLRLEGHQLIFQGMTFVVALDEKGKTQEWTYILKAAGASVMSAKKNKDCAEHLDAVLVDSMVMAAPKKIETILHSIDVKIPAVDLSWAVQSLIARKKLDFNKDDRFIKRSGVYSIKIRGQGGIGVRYEKGDTVKICHNGDTCYGRITNICGKVGERMLSVEIMDRYGEVSLIDGGASSASLNISEKDLVSHIVVFSPEQCKGLKYVDNNKDVFLLQRRLSNIGQD